MGCLARMSALDRPSIIQSPSAFVQRGYAAY
jgi:hypothetical protein